jgi:glycosyltransferase involved in cell wall biosynthesis
MKIVVYPWDPTPYYHLLYDEMQALGAQVYYAGRLTPSQTANLLLLPLETAAWRVRGAKIIHLHWAFSFVFPGADRIPVLRRVAQWWFRAWLWTIRALHMRLVWTAHNVLPHDQVFADDVTARVLLVEASTLVLAHSRSALSGLREIGASPRRSAVIRHGPYAPTVAITSLRTPGEARRQREFLFFGKVQAHKGVEDLITAFSQLPDQVDAHLTIAGECSDDHLRDRLAKLSVCSRNRIVLRLEHIPAEDVTPLLNGADVVVLPYQKITTSGTAVLALCHGRPVVVPNVAALADLPGAAVVRYDGSITSLVGALSRLALVNQEKLGAMSASALAYASEITWKDVAEKTMFHIRAAL